MENVKKARIKLMHIKKKSRSQSKSKEKKTIYEKAKKNRKGAVREMRTKEIGKYQGETTGIRTTITRSRRLG
jgi:U3 small nucleolar RNA-associated protein 3